MNCLYRIVVAAGLVAATTSAASAQTRAGEDIAQTRRALSAVNSALRLGYYDPSFHGLDMDSLYKVAKAELESAKNTQQRYVAIERMLAALDDSHTAFVAPWRVSLAHYRFGFHFYGDTPLVTKVDAGSPAANAGLIRGDEIVTFAGRKLTRESLNTVYFNLVSQDSLTPLELTVRGQNGSLSAISISPDTMFIRKMSGSQFRKLYSSFRDSAEFATSHIQASIADSVFVWRLPQFADIDKGLGDVVDRARKHAVVIMDLRGNPGGSIATLTKILGYFVDQDLVVGDLHMRTSKEKFVAKPNKKHIGGRIFILVDSETASAAEIFARLMQLQGKATVVGDRTAGAVMASQYFPADDEMGAYVTVSDFVLYNGERLEKVGVKPDLLAIETPRHIVAGGDPVLALALIHSGVKISAAAAKQVLADH